jgi:acetyl-CoA carboxylase biotin carboxyl carrier protein
LNLKELKELLQLLDEKEITEFELEEGGMKLRVRKASAIPAAPAMASADAVAAPPAAAGLTAAPAASAPPAAAAAETPATPAAAEEGTVVVKSPIVGTFYRSPDPNAAAFVEIGDRVKPGQVLCIVEAMKLMNEIEAETAGTILKAHAENGQPIQYGDPLFTIRLD